MRRSWLIALCLVAAACASAEPGSDGGTESPVPSTGTTTRGSPSAAATTTVSSPPAGNGGTTPPAAATPATTVNDLGGVGANGRAILRSDFPRLVIEIDRQQGVSPGTNAQNHLAAVLDAVADKPSGIVFGGGNVFSSSRTSWTAGDLRAAAGANRSNHSGGDTVVIYLLYVRGSFVQSGNETRAIGVAYNASEAALFPQRWSGLGGGPLSSNQAIERAVVVHEAGHLLGLVNLTYESDIAHEDPDHPGHSSNRGSVMYYAVETTLIGTLFNGPPPDDFDGADRADLEGLRSGRS